MSDITDITWAMMTEAGLDISKIERVPSSLGGEDYVWQSDDRKIAFGPGVDMEDGGTHGWDICTYDWVDDAWDGVRQQWVLTASEAVAYVASEVPGS